jgi:DNA-binding LacI/PurR family transcriptional regulator
MGVTIKDVAKKTGVSITTVSLVLNNKYKKNRISEKTSKKIREVANQMNYGGLKKQICHSSSLGFIFSSNFSVCCPEIFPLIDSICRNRGFCFSFATVTTGRESEKVYLEQFLKMGYSYVLIDPTFMSEDCVSQVKSIVDSFDGIPVIYLGMVDATLYPNSFSLSLSQAGNMVSLELQNIGITRVAILTDDAWLPVATAVNHGMNEGDGILHPICCQIVNTISFNEDIESVKKKLSSFDGILCMSGKIYKNYLCVCKSFVVKEVVVLRYLNEKEISKEEYHSIVLHGDWLYRKSIGLAINLISNPEICNNPEIIPTQYQE